MEVLYEDNHLLAIVKPARLPTMGVAEGEPSLLTQAKEYLRVRYHKPGNVYLGVVSRLDAPVSGVVVFARTSKAAARLAHQFRSRSVEKTYWAVVEGSIEPPAGELLDWLAKDERLQRMLVVDPSQRGAKQARLSYRLLKLAPVGSLLEIQLHTGRKHQIRVQFANCGFPILGDVKYGAKRSFPAGIALHARRIAFEHPVKKTLVALEAPLPRSWRHIAGAS